MTHAHRSAASRSSSPHAHNIIHAQKKAGLFEGCIFAHAYARTFYEENRGEEERRREERELPLFLQWILPLPATSLPVFILLRAGRRARRQAGVGISADIRDQTSAGGGVISNGATGAAGCF